MGSSDLTIADVTYLQEGLKTSFLTGHFSNSRSKKSFGPDAEFYRAAIYAVVSTTGGAELADSV